MVAILLGTGFEESEALVPADLLRRAGIEVRLVGVDGPAVTSAHGVTVTADLTLAELDREAVDMLVLPGGLGGVEVLQGDRHVQALIQHCYDEGRWLAAICAAPTILANLGFLDRRRAFLPPDAGMHRAGGHLISHQDPPLLSDSHLWLSHRLNTMLCAFFLCCSLLCALPERRESVILKKLSETAALRQ